MKLPQKNEHDSKLMKVVKKQYGYSKKVLQKRNKSANRNILEKEPSPKRIDSFGPLTQSFEIPQKSQQEIDISLSIFQDLNFKKSTKKGIFSELKTSTENPLIQIQLDQFLEQVQSQNEIIHQLKQQNFDLNQKINNLHNSHLRQTELGNVEFLLEEEKLLNKTKLGELIEENEDLKSINKELQIEVENLKQKNNKEKHKVEQLMKEIKNLEIDKQNESKEDYTKIFSELDQAMVLFQNTLQHLFDKLNVKFAKKPVNDYSKMLSDWGQQIFSLCDQIVPPIKKIFNLYSYTILSKQKKKIEYRSIIEQIDLQNNRLSLELPENSLLFNNNLVHSEINLMAKKIKNIESYLELSSRGDKKIFNRLL